MLLRSRLPSLLCFWAVTAAVLYSALPYSMVSSLQPQPRLSSPPTPSDDEFYRPSPGFESNQPGAILKTRSIIVATLGLLPVPTRAYQLLYRTVAIDGSAIATVTTTFVPQSPTYAKDKFVTFATAEDSSAPQCAPSYNYRFLSQQNSAIVDAEFLLLQAYLMKNIIVASSDYEGPNSSFGAGRLAGKSVLDGIRAVQAFSELNLEPNVKVVGIGYSGGAIATGWAASLQAKYAPELNIAGWGFGGTPSNLTGTFMHIDNTLFSGFLPLFSGFLPPAIQGLQTDSAYPKLKPVINEIATDAAKDAIQYAATHCGIDVVLKYPYQTISSEKYNTEGARFLYDERVAKVLGETVMGSTYNETPKAPIFMFHASQDEIIPYSNATSTFEKWCEAGLKSGRFVTYASGGHATAEFLSVSEFFPFVDQAFAGNVTSGCTRETVYNDVLDPLSLGIELEPILIKLVDLIVDILGVRDQKVKEHPANVCRSLSL